MDPQKATLVQYVNEIEQLERSNNGLLSAISIVQQICLIDGHPLPGKVWGEQTTPEEVQNTINIYVKYYNSIKPPDPAKKAAEVKQDKKRAKRLKHSEPVKIDEARQNGHDVKEAAVL